MEPDPGPIGGICPGAAGCPRRLRSRGCRSLNLGDDVQKALAGFLWDEWAQMGVSASTGRRDAWATDPEALLLLTFEVGRGEPRLFEEVLDWMLVNERLLSVQRLRNLAVDDEDRAAGRGGARMAGPNSSSGAVGVSDRRRPRDSRQPFFRGSRPADLRSRPRLSLAQGFLTRAVEPAGSRRLRNFELPINFAFRSRLLLGSQRACGGGPSSVDDRRAVDERTGSRRSTAYTKRNVQEAVTSLASAGFSIPGWSATKIATGVEASVGSLPRVETAARIPRTGRSCFRAYRSILRWLSDATHPRAQRLPAPAVAHRT